MKLISSYKRRVILPDGEALPEEVLRFSAPHTRAVALEVVNDWNRIASLQRESAPGSPSQMYWIEP